jgi:hypothetical protein
LDAESGLLHYLNGAAALVFALIEEHGYEQAMTELEKMQGDDPQYRAELPGLIKDLTDKGILIDE